MKGMLQQLANLNKCADFHRNDGSEGFTSGWIIHTDDEFTSLIHWDQREVAQGFKIVRTSCIQKISIWPDPPETELRNSYDISPWAGIKDFHSLLTKAQEQNRLAYIIDTEDEDYYARVLNLDEDAVWFEDIGPSGAIQNQTILPLDSITYISVDTPLMQKVEAKLKA